MKSLAKILTDVPIPWSKWLVNADHCRTSVHRLTPSPMLRPSPPDGCSAERHINWLREPSHSVLSKKNMNTLHRTLIVVGFCQLFLVAIQAQDLESIAPVIVKTVPEAGSKDVAPGVAELRVTFSKPMTDQSWSWSTAWKDSVPEAVGKPKYEADQKTCVLRVKLEPNKTYGYWLNSQNFHGFRDQQNHPAVPYLLAFRTKGN